MTAFGEWRAHAEPDYIGRGFRLNIGRETGPATFQIISAEPVVQTIHRDNATSPQGGISLPHEVAEALYHALHRVFGHVNQDGKVEALQESLDKERARVDLLITTMVRPRAQVTT